MFLNISTDYIQLVNAQEQKLIYRNHVEKEFGPALLQRVKKHNSKKIFLLNGPGWFTNLRVASLLLNLYQQLDPTQLEIRETSKLDVFAYAVAEWVLPASGAVYIGQKKTLWWYNFEKWEYQVMNKNNLPYAEQDIFLDKVYDQEYFGEKIMGREIDFARGEKGLMMTYGEKILNLESLPIRQKVDAVVPNYMVKPVIWAGG